MASHIVLCFLLVLFTTCSFFLGDVFSETADNEKTYIVYMGSAPVNLDPSNHHLSMLSEIKGSDKAAGSIIHSYTKSFNGFVAKLTAEEAHILSGKEGVISVFENKINNILTTHSWDFLRMSSEAAPRNVLNESRIVIGMIDTGIWPESESFNDEGLSPLQSTTWNGICDIGGDRNFSCNNKIVGARFYRLKGEIPTNQFRSPRDAEGHGTHTSATAAGVSVPSASFYGLGEGTARGGVPAARIAVYKVCWSQGGCTDADILAAFHDAIDDGVDIISISVGVTVTRYYYDDPIAIGSFHALKKGILTSAAAGNSGPELGTVFNNAPWALSVAASTTDRKFFTAVELDNGEIIEGFSANEMESGNSMSELVQLSCPTTEADDVGGRIVLCHIERTMDGRWLDVYEIIRILHRGGAAGVLMPYLRETETQRPIYPFIIPQATLSLDALRQTSNYINSTSYPKARILKTTQMEDPTAPLVAGFSSRGPSLNDPQILKPDVAAPGMNILAAWSGAAPVSDDEQDDRRVSYRIDSGTSMACPHASAVAAYIKSFFPDWSPSTIMSALITTATPMSPNDNIGGAFGYGAGNINPIAAIDPGLVYQINPNDFVSVLCTEGYNSTQLRNITGEETLCTSDIVTKTIWDLNYPSFSVYVADISKPVSAHFSRTLTNVGPAGTYKATVDIPAGFDILIEPNSLNFECVGDEKPFQVFLNGMLTENFTFGSLTWYDGVHRVRSAIAISSWRPKSN